MSFVDFFTVFSAIFTAFFYYFKTILKNKASSVQLIDTLLKHNYFEFYRLRLKSTLHSIDNKLGKPQWSWLSIAENLSFHYSIAIVYVFLIFFIIWFLGGHNSIGTLEILPKKEGYWERFLVILVLIIIGFTYYYLSSKKFENLGERLKNKFTSFLPNTLQKYSHLIIKSFEGIIFFLFFFIFQSFTTALIFSLLFILFDISLFAVMAVILAVGGGVAIGAFLNRGEVIIAILLTAVEGRAGLVIGLAGIISLIVTGTFFNSITNSILIFLLIIPLLNALLDFISLSISRYFSRKIVNDNNIFWIIIHLLIDFLLAILFLLALAGILYYSIELFNTVVDKKLQINIGNMLYATVQNPFSIENAWISFMLLSTLLPTLLHLLLALVSIVLYVTKSTDWFVMHIDKSQKSESKQIITSGLLAFPLTILSLILFYILVYLPMTSFLPTPQ